MTQEELSEVLIKHQLWLEDEGEGERASLDGANLYGASLNGANLYGASLNGANLERASLEGANLYGASLNGANLYGASLEGASLYGANLERASLEGANLYGASLERANLNGASLEGASLYGANLERASLEGANFFLPILCPEMGAFIGWKTASGKIIKLEILADARRSSATGRKCRCDKAKVLEIQEPDGAMSDCVEVTSDYDSTFVYKLDEIVEVKNFETDRFKECAAGIHFFVTREEAVRYFNR